MRVSTQYKNDKLTHKELKHSAVFMIAHLIEEDEHKKTNITIICNTEKISKKWKRNSHLWGLTIPDKKNKFKFKIYLNPKLSKRRQLLTLAHELVHVKQFIRSELGDTYEFGKSVFTKWNNKLINEDDLDYDFYPWEIEANGRENGLYQRWIDYKRKEKIKFDQ